MIFDHDDMIGLHSSLKYKKNDKINSRYKKLKVKTHHDLGVINIYQFIIKNI